jgi:hypothetical protein
VAVVVRSFRWLVSLAAVSVIALVAATVYLAVSADEDGTFGRRVDREIEIDGGLDDEIEIDGGFDDDDSADEDEPFEYGDDALLDDLYDQCEDGDLVACDDLYFESPEGSAYESFGSTCGGAEDDLFGDCSATLDDEEDLGADLDALHDLCEEGDMGACDELYFESPIGSDEEEFGSTCGGRQDETNGDCA